MWLRPGTMYVGGWRLTLDNPVPLNNQPDWLDQPASDCEGAAAGNEVVTLLLTGADVSAVEDQALLLKLLWVGRTLPRVPG